MPVSGHVSSEMKSDTSVSVSGAIAGKTKDFKGDDTHIIPMSLSLWKKSDEDTTYEFYFVGVRRIDEIYKNGSFYFDVFTSMYFSIPVIGSNLGFTTGLKFKYTDIYASIRADGLMYLPLLSDESKAEIIFYRHIKPAVGVTFNFDKFNLFMEASVITYTKTCNGKDYIENEFKDMYFIYLGILYKLQ